MLLVFLLSLAFVASTGSVQLPLVDIATLDKIDETFSDVIENVGGIAFTGLGVEYSKALTRLNSNAPSCPDNFYEMDLEDGSVRLTFGKDSTDAEKKFPVCVEKEADIIANTMDAVDNMVMNMLNKVIGKEVLAVMNNTNKLYLEDLPSRTHLHVYKTEVARHSSRHGHSYPFHIDNGLYLLVTPGISQPLILTNRQGQVVTTAHLPADSMILIVGGGLSNWLLPHSSKLSPFAAPHAVPTLSSPHRTVLARMKLAPLSSNPLHSQTTFQEHFSMTKDASLCPLNTWETAHRSMCAEGESMCWMDTCLPVPEDCTESPVCVNETLEPCCTPDVTEDCLAHDESCYWAC